jgi:DNA-binding response OmpR family regulator
MADADRYNPAGGKMSVLVVEDDKFLHKILLTKFQKEGFEVRGAMDGEEALQVLLTFQPTIILLDLILPKMNGFEVLSEVKTNAKTAPIPVIVLSNLSQDEDVRRATELGAIGFMVKADLSINEVVLRVKEAYAKFLAQRKARP